MLELEGVGVESGTDWIVDHLVSGECEEVNMEKFKMAG
jgi:hypothetical protein